MGGHPVPPPRLSVSSIKVTKLTEELMEQCYQIRNQLV